MSPQQPNHILNMLGATAAHMPHPSPPPQPNRIYNMLGAVPAMPFAASPLSTAASMASTTAAIGPPSGPPPGAPAPPPHSMPMEGVSDPLSGGVET